MKLIGGYVLAAGLAAAVLSPLSGCGREAGVANWDAVPQTGGMGDVTLYRDIGFSDLPIPEGYELLERESHSFQGSLSRSGVFHYQGTVEWGEAMEFFRTRLPEAGWSPVSSGRGPDFRELRFRKGQEQLIVVVRQIRGGSRTELQLDNPDRSDLLLKGRLPRPSAGGERRAAGASAWTVSP
ncbi:MAG: hypothetical protein LBV15_04145 [Planctomycetota bacterium]|jgi:hypothetical protein|nr:hypothetical protein [Planctomycetota bacterium]